MYLFSAQVVFMTSSMIIGQYYTVIMVTGLSKVFPDLSRGREEELSFVVAPTSPEPREKKATY